MVYVIKRGGKKEVFNPSKIKRGIERAAKDAKINSLKIKQLISEVADPFIEITKKKKSIKATEIRKSILRRIDRRAKSVSNAWRKFEKRKR